MVRVNLNLDVEVLTAVSVADVINGILEFLLYQRNQIPFIYNTFKYYVNNWSCEAIANTSGNRLTQLNLERQRDEAKQTKNAITTIQKLITKLLEQNSVKCMRFVFGSTTFTPKEVYVVNIPTTITNIHYPQYHRICDEHLNKILRTFLTSEELFGVFSTNLCPTNLFLEFELCDYGSGNNKNVQDKELNIFPKDISQLPKSCREICVQLLHSNPADVASTSCLKCKNVNIFEDHLGKTPSKLDNHNNAVAYDTVVECKKSNWWEADVIIRGFKEKPIKGVNIWHK